ncbi:Uncharacterized protein Fot_31734 [Forsythia ovata]|uniref:Uncharacterized protein n=1 Tax=Forsythia ovata TaxID=205694 RepID=A0ABD1T5V4_9LAMI
MIEWTHPYYSINRVYDAGGDVNLKSNCNSFVKGKVPKAKLLHLCQRPLNQAGCKLRDVHEWQGPERERANMPTPEQTPQYFSENLPHTRIEHVLSEDFSPRHLKLYQLAYVPGGVKLQSYVYVDNYDMFILDI